MIFDIDSTAAADEPKVTVKCPHCTAQLMIEQDKDNPKPDDPVSCYFHGIIGTRLEILHAVKNGDLEMVSEQVDHETAERPLNKWGYHPQAGDNSLLARAIFAEAAHYPRAHYDVGWSIVNRIGAPGFAKTLWEVLNQHKIDNHKHDHKQFDAVGSLLWQDAGDPSSLTGPNLQSYDNALRVANGILDGKITDPTGGATYFFSGPEQGWFKDQMDAGRLVQAGPKVTPYTFLKQP